MTTCWNGEILDILSWIKYISKLHLFQNVSTRKNLNYMSCIYGSPCNSSRQHWPKWSVSHQLPPISNPHGPLCWSSTYFVYLRPLCWLFSLLVKSSFRHPLGYFPHLSSVLCKNYQKEPLWAINLRWPLTHVYTYYLYFFKT